MSRHRRFLAGGPVVLAVALTTVSCSAGPPPTVDDALATVCEDVPAEPLDAGPYDDYDGAEISETRADLTSCEVELFVADLDNEVVSIYYGAHYGVDPTEDMEQYADSAQESDGGDVTYAIAGSDDDWTVVWVIEPWPEDLDRLAQLEDDGFEVSASDQGDDS